MLQELILNAEQLELAVSKLRVGLAVADDSIGDAGSVLHYQDPSKWGDQPGPDDFSKWYKGYYQEVYARIKKTAGDLDDLVRYVLAAARSIEREAADQAERFHDLVDGWGQ